MAVPRARCHKPEHQVVAAQPDQTEPEPMAVTAMAATYHHHRDQAVAGPMVAPLAQSARHRRAATAARTSWAVVQESGQLHQAATEPSVVAVLVLAPRETLAMVDVEEIGIRSMVPAAVVAEPRDSSRRFLETAHAAAVVEVQQSLARHKPEAMAATASSPSNIRIARKIAAAAMAVVVAQRSHRSRRLVPEPYPALVLYVYILLISIPQ